MTAPVSCHCLCHRGGIAVGQAYQFGGRRTNRGNTRNILDDTGPWWLYQITEDGVLRYVGQSVNPAMRYRQHRARYRTTGHVLTILARYDDRADALAAEAAMIRDRRPPDNVVGRERAWLTTAELRRQRATFRRMEAAERAEAARWAALPQITVELP